jgi:hypothetical protein
MRLFWITREVLRTNSRRVALTGKAMDGSVGNTLSAFMRELAVIAASAGGGKHSDAKRLKEQMRPIIQSLCATITLGRLSGRRWRPAMKLRAGTQQQRPRPKTGKLGIPLTQVRADSDGTVGRMIVFRRLPPSPRLKARQTTINDGLPHGTAGTQPE